jgi:hypothetical protein
MVQTLVSIAVAKDRGPVTTASVDQGRPTDAQRASASGATTDFRVSEDVMLSSQEDQAERRRVLQNDQRVREQTGTYLSHTHDDAGGRFAAISNAQVVGAQPTVNYPAASSSWQIQLPDEPPLGYRIDDLNPSDPAEASSFAQQATGEPTAPSSTIPLIDDVERVGSPLSQGSAGPSRSTKNVADVGLGDQSALPPHRRY